jgi:hypothetical protein
MPSLSVTPKDGRPFAGWKRTETCSSGSPSRLTTPETGATFIFPQPVVAKQSAIATMNCHALEVLRDTRTIEYSTNRVEAPAKQKSVDQ